MSFYRSTYVPWKSSPRSSSNKSDDRVISSLGSSRYGCGTNSYRPGINNSTYLSTPVSSASSPLSTPSRYSSSVSSLRKKYSSISQNNTKSGVQSGTTPDDSRKEYGKNGVSSMSKTTDNTAGGRYGNQNAKKTIKERSPSVSRNFNKQINSSGKVTVITRSTSPTPPPNSTFLRTKRANLEKVIKSEVEKNNLSDLRETGTQTDEIETRRKESSLLPHSRVSNLGSRFLNVNTNSSSKFRSGYRGSDLDLRKSPIPKSYDKVQNSTSELVKSSQVQNCRIESATSSSPDNARSKTPSNQNINNLEIGGYFDKTSYPSQSNSRERSPNRINLLPNDPNSTTVINNSFLPISKRSPCPSPNVLRPYAIHPVTSTSINNYNDISELNHNNLRVFELNKSLSNLKLSESEQVNNSNSDTESDSSYNENYPLNINEKNYQRIDSEPRNNKINKEHIYPEESHSVGMHGMYPINYEERHSVGIQGTYPINYEDHHSVGIHEKYAKNCNSTNNASNLELLDKPPKYPISPKVKNKSFKETFASDAKLLNIRSISTSSASSSRADNSSSEDISERSDSMMNSKNIPKIVSNTSENQEPDSISVRKQYPIRKMDSGEIPWWMEEESDLPQNKEDVPNLTNEGYKIRKMDSTEIEWWNHKEEENLKSEEAYKEPEVKRDYCYQIRKMDSGDMPWWYNTDTATVDNNAELGVRRTDVDNPRANGSNATVNSGTYNNGIDNISNSPYFERNNIQMPYKIRKMDSGEAPWWLNNDETTNKDETDFSRIDSNKNNEIFNKTVVILNCTSNSAIDYNELNNVEDGKVRKLNYEGKEWWLSENESNPDTKIREPDNCVWRNENANQCVNDITNNNYQYIDDYKTSQIRKIKKIDPRFSSGMISNDKAESYSKVCNISRIDSGEKPWWMDNDANEETDDQKQLDNSNDYNVKSNFRFLNDLDNLLLYIGEYTNIDDLLGTEVPPPAAPVTPSDDESSDDIGEDCTRIPAYEVRIHDGSAHTSTIQRRSNFGALDDTALQLYKDGDYGSYLDLDASISEQQEEFDGFQPSRRDAIVIRTQLSVRVHMIKEKLLKSEGRELRRALFSLKQVFQEDKDLVHEFVQNDGLDCLIKVGSDVDQNYQNYILRALGQVMLYVDGMNGVMEHNATIQWLYSLVCSKFRLVIKTALKLLLVFVEYAESNCFLLIQAIHTFDVSRDAVPWTNIMKLLHQFDITDIDVLIYAMTLINKTLNGLSDQDTYYDQVDLLEEQNIQSVIQWYMSKQGTNLDLLRQFQIYEAVLQYEDGEDKVYSLKQLDESIRKTLRNRKSLTYGQLTNVERRRSRRHSTGNSSLRMNTYISSPLNNSDTSMDEYTIKHTANGAGVTPGLRKRRERAERQRSLLREQYETNMRAMMMLDTSSSSDDVSGMQNGCINATPRVFVPSTVNKIESQNMDDLTDTHNYCNGDVSPILRETCIKDITQKLVVLQSPSAAEEPPNRMNGSSIVGEMKGIISKAMEGLAKSQSRCDIIRSPSSESGSSQMFRVPEIKKSETDLRWEELLSSSTRALHLCDLDFTDLKSDDEHDVLAPTSNINGIPPPPPPCGIPPPVPTIPKQIKKQKKTVKLFWKEVRDDPIVMTKLNSKSLIWDEMNPVDVDTQKLEHLFESRAKDLITKKQHELNKNKEIIVLDPKRSNAINIGMTKLPPPRSIKTAILKMDATVMNREGIEKLLMMLPTEDERNKIQEAQSSNPELPLGSAEHFLLTLSSISELTARLKLWSFKLNYENCEKEIAEPLMDLKQGMEILHSNLTFRAILSTLLSIGIFLNGTEVKGFQIEYLAKVPEVKDTVHKHSLLHHLCHIAMEKFPESTDLYSEIGAITRASRVDFDDLCNNIQKIEQECKASFDYLKAIAKHDGNTAIKVKISDFLADCAERIITLKKIHKRVLNRFHKFCLWLGIPLHRIQMTKPNEICRVISEFALEYRTTRERVIQQLEKKASHRERNKTRGKMITEMGKFRSQEDKKDAELRQLLGRDNGSENCDNNNSVSHLQGGSLPWRRQRKDIARNMREQNSNGHSGDAGDELLESLVKNATQAPSTRTAPRERKRTRHAERKSLIPKRSRTRDNLLHRSTSGSIS